MRRPRAFTCSRLRAEPLPPPPRKPLGYAALNEDSWGTILRSSSPCKCGGCGLDSSSSPKATPSSRLPESRLPESTTVTPIRHHAWENITFDSTPPRPEPASVLAPDSPAFDHLSKFPAARRLPLREEDAAHARRIVSNLKPECCPKEADDATLTTINNSIGNKSSSSIHSSNDDSSYAAVGGSNWSSERKRGSDESDSENSRGNFSASVLSQSFGTATATATTATANPAAINTTAAAAVTAPAAATAAASCAAAAAATAAAAAAAATASAGSENCGGFFGASISQTASEARTYAAAAAFASLIASPAPAAGASAGDGDGAGAGAGASVKGCGGSHDEDWSGPGRQGFGAPVEGGSVPFGGSFSKQPFVGVSAGPSPNGAGRGGSSSTGGASGGATRGGGGGGGGGSNVKVNNNKGLEEWKAPETDGIFSLGAPPQPAGLGRRRRMRVGG